MDLKALILPMKTVEFDYPGVDGLKFNLSFINKGKLNSIRKSHLKMIKNKHTGSFSEELDEDSFMKEYSFSIVAGWSGLTVGNIQEFLVMPDDMDQDTVVPYTEDNAYQLLTNSKDLDTWVSEMISDIENFRNQESKKKEQE